MAQYESEYQPIMSADEEPDVAIQDSNVMIHQAPDAGKSTWNHIENLDEFFTRVYQYHQRSGFLCMVMEDGLQLLQFVFVVVFSVFLLDCIDYDVLFANKHYNGTHKVTLHEAIYSPAQCSDRVGATPVVVICIVIASLFWVLRALQVIYNVSKYLEMKSFYTYALKISSKELCNMTWHDVQLRLREVQKEQQMCIHKQELTELDIYHRILRFKNYQVAMINKSLLPLKYNIPFLGEYVFLTTGLKYNLEFILFWGPWSPFENYWHLKPDYRSAHKRKDLADYLSQKIMWIGLANFLLSPLIFLWQILYSFFRYAEIIKREPGTLGARRWSLYSRLYLRHFNELDHEFMARLNRAYRPATRYMSTFVSPTMAIAAKNVAFFAGSILAALIALAVIDEDTLQAEHILTIMTLCGGVVACCRVFIPDEHLIFNPEILLSHVLAEVHYMPDQWRGSAHTIQVRDEFSQLFQYKVLYILEELFSPLITPIILCFYLRHKAIAIVDFYRNFSVEVVGVGDVCSFAQMDVKKHGNPQWVRQSATEATQYTQGEDGKTELSLMHFTLTNPAWKPPDDCSMFLQEVKQHAEDDAHTQVTGPLDNPLLSSLYAVNSIGPGYTSINLSCMPPTQSLLTTGAGLSERSALFSTHQTHHSQISSVRGNIARTEGPLGGGNNGLLASLHSSGALSGQDLGPGSLSANQSVSMMGQDNLAAELSSTEMAFSALYLHELHRRRRTAGPSTDRFDELRSRTMWRQDSELPSICEHKLELESGEEEINQEDDRPPSLIDPNTRRLSKSS